MNGLFFSVKKKKSLVFKFESGIFEPLISHMALISMNTFTVRRLTDESTMTLHFLTSLYDRQHLIFQRI